MTDAPGSPPANATESTAAGLSPEEAAAEGNYRPLCQPALVAVLLGVASFLALLHPVLWVVPVLGLLTAGWALYRLAQEPRQAGRLLALVGLALSVGFCLLAPARQLTHDWLLRRDGRHFAELWFRSLAQRKIQFAHQLTLAPAKRRRLDASLFNLYQKDEQLRDELEVYSRDPLRQLLLALGDRARVRYYETEELRTALNDEMVGQVFVVDYEDGGNPVAFFVRVDLLRYRTPAERGRWSVDTTRGGYRPQSWGERG